MGDVANDRASHIAPHAAHRTAATRKTARRSLRQVAEYFLARFRREYPHLSALLRQRVSPRAASLTLEAIMRRQELEPAPRVALFRDLASSFKEITPFPPEATEGVSDEQYVRNVADVLFR